VYWGQTDITESELDLTAGAAPDTKLVVTMASDGGQIEGVVRNDKQEPVPSAIVTIIPVGRSKAAYYRIAGADRQGKFRALGLAPGYYRIFAWEKVDVNAVLYDPDFLRPHESGGTNLQIGASERKMVELRAIPAEN
jgi:hypothetical protein